MKSKNELLDLFVGKNDFPKYILGTNEQGLSVAKMLHDKVIFVNEFSSDDNYEGFPVIHSIDDIPHNAIVLNSVWCHYPVTTKKKLDKAGLTNVDIYAAVKYFNIPFEPYFWQGFKESYAAHKDEYEQVYNALCDEKSKDTFRRLIDLRVNNNVDSLMVFETDEINQYYEDFLNLQEEGESFVDVGGFDGNTTLQFIKRCPSYEKVFFFEPEPKIMELARKNLAGYERIQYCQYAASDKKQTLHFSSNDSASKITDAGGIEIQADKIDSLVDSKVTFIKMDIEGSESVAIEGARETILKYHPRLAICVYHKGADYVDIPRQVLSIRNDYDLYMRHYTEGVTETVMFFMPKK